MNTIEKLFSSDKNNLLSIYFTAGYPKLDDTATIIKALEKSGVDMLEIGFPFSDPLADGPVIQQSSKKALDNGMTLAYLFEQLQAIKKEVTIPLVLMGYMNPVLQFGVERFLSKCKDCGVHAVILPDLPPEEYEAEYRQLFNAYGVDCVFLITPQTSEDRIKYLEKLTGAFLYMVSTTATTGSSVKQNEETENYFRRIQSMNLSKPTMTGFGVKDRQSYQHVCQYARGAIIGTAFIKALEKADNLEKAISEFITALR